MSFLHSCILLLGVLATGSPAPVPVDPAAQPVPGALALQAASGPRPESPATRPRTRAGDGSAGEGRAVADVRRKSSGTAGDDEPGSAVPGAFVAVIFGIFGVLVIGRRSRR